MEKKYTSVNDRIFKLLIEKGISQRELSDLTGISTSAISDWKHKGAKPSAYNVQKICKALGVSSESLLGEMANQPDDIYYIDKDHDLYEFVKLYNSSQTATRKHVLAYAVGMLNETNN